MIADGLSRLSEDELSNCVAFTCQVVDLDLDLVKEEQDKDVEIRDIKADLLLRPETVSDFVLINDCFYLKPTKNNSSSRLFIPKSLVPRVLMICHSHKLAGHPGVQKTQNLVSKNYFWRHCRRDAKEFVLNCDVCQLSRGNVMKRVPLEPYPSDLSSVSLWTQWGLSLGQLMVIGTFWFSWIICPNILKLFQLRVERPLALRRH